MKGTSKNQREPRAKPWASERGTMNEGSRLPERRVTKHWRSARRLPKGRPSNLPSPDSDFQTSPTAGAAAGVFRSPLKTSSPSSPAWLVAAFLACASLLAQGEPDPPSKAEGWIQLFNGKDLTGWTPKIRFEPYGEDSRQTFRVENGVIRVGYEKYESFNSTFGHLFYKTPFSRYRLRVEYRFVGEQAKGGPGWAFRNSGLMLHGQDPATMKIDQEFPDSIEVQLLGGRGEGERTTMNLCTPGTDVIMNGKLLKQHCIESKSKTYHGNQWVTVEVLVDGAMTFKHLIDGEVVLEYQAPQLDDGTLLESGTISIQSESHPCEFRRIELQPLD